MCPMIVHYVVCLLFTEYIHIYNIHHTYILIYLFIYLFIYLYINYVQIRDIKYTVSLAWLFLTEKLWRVWFGLIS